MGSEQMSRLTALPDNPNLTLVIGGARSGKSSHAEQLVRAFDPPWIYLATAQAFDEEMRERIALHRTRRDDKWQTIEAPVDLTGALRSQPSTRPVLIDCLTLWLSNNLLAGNDIEEASTLLVEALDARRGPTFAVTNEVGQGIVPDNALSRQFRDAAGRLNQMAAAAAGTVILMTAGIAMQVK